MFGCEGTRWRSRASRYCIKLYGLSDCHRSASPRSNINLMFMSCIPVTQAPYTAAPYIHMYTQSLRYTQSRPYALHSNTRTFHCRLLRSQSKGVSAAECTAAAHAASLTLPRALTLRRSGDGHLAIMLYSNHHRSAKRTAKRIAKLLMPRPRPPASSPHSSMPPPPPPSSSPRSPRLCSVLPSHG